LPEQSVLLWIDGSLIARELNKMTLAGWKDLLTRFQGNPPTSLESIARCQASLGVSLPSDYVQFLQRMNGGEVFIGERDLMLWSVEDFIEMNTGTYFAEAAPGLIVFGSDGGGEAFGFDTRTAPPPIVVAPYVGMEWDVAYRIAPTFDLFLQHLYKSEDLF
jgi:hypothetical protein